MSNHYKPNIHEAVIPEDGGWTDMEGQPVLILSIPEWTEIVNQSAEGYQYAWLFERKEDAYIFCFRLTNQQEFAIVFAKDHAGLLLQDDKANQEFSFLITDDRLDDADHKSTFLWLKQVSFRKHPGAIR